MLPKQRKPKEAKRGKGKKKIRSRQEEEVSGKKKILSQNKQRDLGGDGGRRRVPGGGEATFPGRG